MAQKKQTKKSSSSSSRSTQAKKQTSKARSAASKGKQVAQKATSTRRKRSALSVIMPYILILLAVIFLICLITVGFLEIDDGAGVIGKYIHDLSAGLFGGGAILIPFLLGYIGVLWCVFHFKWNERDMQRGSEKFKDYRKAHRKAVGKTVYATLFVTFISSLVGVIANEYDTIDIADMWDGGIESFGEGGVIGGFISCIMVNAFAQIISIILLTVFLVFFAMMILGLTPRYIITRIQYERMIREEEREEERELREQEEYEAEQAALAEAAERRKQAAARAAAAKAEEERRRKQREEEANRRDEEKESGADTDNNNDTNGAQEPESNGNAKEKEVQGMTVDEIMEGFDEDKQSEEDPLEGVEPPKSTEAQSEEGGKHVAGEAAMDYADESAEENREYRGVDDLLKDFIDKKNEPAEEQKPAEEKPAAPISLNQMDADEIREDMSEVAPDEGATEAEPTEVELPYIFPPYDLLEANKAAKDEDYTQELQENAQRLVETLRSFKVGISDITYSRGPTITRYELKPNAGTRVRAIANLVDDIALSLASSGVRIEAPIPNKPAVGIEVPNRNRATVYLRELIENSKFSEAKSKLTASLGMDVGGNPVYFDISKMPHMIIAGATGMGKSVCINGIIISILYKAKPEDVKLILIDPKKVEFALYRDIPHLYAPIVSEPKKAAGALASAVAEMERRFELIEEAGVRDIATYNKVTENDPSKEHMCHMVIIIDELADLMMTAPDEVEASICRLAQKARAAGIHIIIGTQRPSVDVITGLIKANIPSRIACTVASQVDSRTIIDIAGAEKLIGRGDMLFAPVGAAKPMRVQGAFVSEKEVEDVVTFIKENNAKAKYNADFVSRIEEEAAKCGMGKKGAAGGAPMPEDIGGAGGGDTKFRDAVKLAVDEGKIATSLLQRRLGVGYGRAAKIIDMMEALGYVSKADGTKPRRTLLTMEEYMRRAVDGTLETGGSPAGDDADNGPAEE